MGDVDSEPITILHLSAVDYGGAGNFTLDLHQLSQQAGYNSYLVVKDKKSEQKDVIPYPDSQKHRLATKLLRRVAKARLSNIQFDYDFYFYNRYESFTVVSAQRILKLVPCNPDVIFIHWVTDFVNAEIIGDLHRLTRAKLYWLMLDNAPITGGCHYPWDCEGYKIDCSNCPAILNNSQKSLAQRNLSFKLENLPKELGLVAFSQSDYVRAKNSTLFRNKEVALLLGYVNETRFKPGNRDTAKTHFGIPVSKKVLFFGASSLKERRKGMTLLLKAIQQIQYEDFFILVAGEMDLKTLSEHNMKMVGHLSEDDLVVAYQAAHIFICPSIEDSGPMMINQSIMCGTPVVAFDTGVAKNLVHNGKTGYKAKLGDITDLAYGIQQLLEFDLEATITLSKNCRSLGIREFGRQAFANHLREIITKKRSTLLNY